MNKLKNTAALVRECLKSDERCRNSDSFLYLEVLSAVAKQKGINIEEMTVPHFLVNLHGASFPCFETVRRTRQKIQATYPELSACEIVEGFRSEKEKEFREFARG